MITSADLEPFRGEFVCIGVPHKIFSGSVFNHYGFLTNIGKDSVTLKNRNGSITVIRLDFILEVKNLQGER